MPGRTQVPDGSRAVFAYGTVTLYGRLSHTFLLTARLLTPICPALQPQPACRLVWAVPRSLATTRGMISFPLGTEMFQFPRFPSTDLCVQPGMLEVLSSGFPHSDIPGSTPVHGSPRLFAVSHVLHRHLAPRHPPPALSSLAVMRRNRSSSLAQKVRFLLL